MQPQSRPQGSAASRENVTVAIRNMESQLLRMRQGEITNDEFRPSRTILGAYGQRQPEEYMVRVRIPFGGLTPNQLRTLAGIAREHGNGTGHVTTRQNMQLPWLKLDQIPGIFKKLNDAGITTLQTGGNSVRTVGACPLAGVCPKEAFDVTPYAKALDDHYVGNKDVLGLPRKIKMGFSGCDQDCSLSAIQDVGAIAQVQGTNGSTRRGFKVFVGGGLGVFPRKAQMLEEFLPEEDLETTTDAVIGLFDKLGDRSNKQKARLKFVLNRIGIEEFRALVSNERSQRRAKGEGDPAPAATPVAATPRAAAPTRPSNGVHGDAAYTRWRSWNTLAQKQSGFATVLIPLRLGDVTAGQMDAIAGLVEGLGADVRTSQQQDLVLRNVPEASLIKVYQALQAQGLTGVRAYGVADVTSCPGASACSLGIVSSKALARQLTEMLQDAAYQEDPALGGLRVKVSGCPDACGQHYMGDIGLYGCALHQDGRLYPAYQLLLGGGVTQEGTRLGRPIVKIPARKVPQAMSFLLELYRTTRNPDERFAAFVDRVGADMLREALAGFTTVPSHEEDPSFYMDWDATRMYIVERGEGECSV